MKIAVFSIPELSLGKHNVKDSRLDQVDAITRSKKKTYAQLELVAGDLVLDAEAILVLKDSVTDLILKDLEFVETRLSRTEQEQEKKFLIKLKGILEKEEPVFAQQFSDEEKKMISTYGMSTARPIIDAERSELDSLNDILSRCLKASGFISFFTTGEKETRAWPVKKGTSAWEAAGQVHSDIQKGFIRAEVISFNDFIQAGSETQAKQQGKMRLEAKDYVVQDADLMNFRFNK